MFVNPGTSSFWHTATNNVLALPVEFPDGATSATLAVSGLRYTATYAGITDSPFILTLPAATSTATENVYDLTLTFDDAGATTRTARLGLIRGYDTTAEGLTRCLAPKEQRKWPWSTDIKVEYKLTNMTGPVTVNVEAFDGNTPLDSSNLKAAIVGDLWGVSESGAHSFIIKPAIAFGAARDSIGDFKVRLSLTDEPTANDIIYKIVDLVSPYTKTDVTRRDLMNGKWGKIATSFSEIDSTFTTSLDDVLIWLDVTNAIYKTDKMVFRRIPAAGKSYMMQTNNASVNGGAGVEVSSRATS